MIIGRNLGVGPFPAIIDMYGGAGGIKEHRSALLAARGFAVLCLPYFGYKTLPKSVLDVDMSYFKVTEFDGPVRAIFL